MNLKMLSRYLCGILQDTMCCVGVSCQASKPYTHPDNPYAITHIQDAYGAHYDFDWDDNGNLVNSHTHATHTDRRLCWTEDNRLQAFIERGGEGGIAAWYNYSAEGERNIKLTSPRLNIQQNATLFSNPPLVYPTLYASSLVTLTKQGYTNVTEVESRASSLALPRCSNVTERKHYFEEGRRICSKLGGGMRGNVTVQEIDSRVGELASSYDEQYHNQKEGIRQTFYHCIGADPQIIDGVNLHRMLIDRELRRDEEEPTYFYHSDHLGSAAYLTYRGGVIQTLNYLPYGEDWVEYNFFHPDDTTRLGIYRFNGKDPRKGWRIPLDEIKYNEQKDYESGFHYYGARYYWGEVLTGWLSIDPLADSLPSISSYDYCLNNPIVMVDVDGNIPIIPIIWAIYEIGSSIYDAYETANTITNPNATTAEKISASTGFFIGLFVPGGGYSKVLKEGTKLSENTIKTFTLNSGRITSKLAASKPMQNLANKLLKYSKDGNLPTPKNNPEQFIRIKGSKNWKHKETGAIYSESPSSHKGKEKGEYKIFPAGTKESEFGTAKESGKRITINKDGEILGT